MQRPPLVFRVGQQVHVDAGGFGIGRGRVAWVSHRLRRVQVVMRLHDEDAILEFTVNGTTTKEPRLTLPPFGATHPIPLAKCSINYVFELTERQWLNCTEPHRLVHHFRFLGHERKLRLFACACARSVGHSLTTITGRRVVEVAERFADGMAGPEELAAAHAAACCPYREYPCDVGEKNGFDAALYAAVVCYYLDDNLMPFPNEAIGSPECERAEKRNDRQHLFFLRDIFGNPFRPIEIEFKWLTAEVRELASAIYSDRDFDRLAILAKALRDAGCEQKDILAHCRADGPHVRGCWVLDLILGK